MATISGGEVSGIKLKSNFPLAKLAVLWGLSCLAGIGVVSQSQPYKHDYKPLAVLFCTSLVLGLALVLALPFKRDIVSAIIVYSLSLICCVRSTQFYALLPDSYTRLIVLPSMFLPLWFLGLLFFGPILFFLLKWLNFENQRR